jgi:type II secretory pathway pseudopilin PulG
MKPINSSFVPALRDHSSFRAAGAFTLIELLTVMAIIIVLAGLIMTTAGYVQKKGYCSRAEAEIAAMSAALENYKADNGIYPRDSVTDAFDVSTPNMPDYNAPNLKLYEYLSGDTTHDRIAETKTYFPFKPNQLSPTDQTQQVTAVRDPFGNSYGYSTAKAANPTGAIGYNPTFDLWSIGDGAPGTDQSRWIKNW